MKPLYHPNALPAHLREKLPDPNRPIDTPVVPATVALFHDTFDPIYQALAESLNQKNNPVASQFPNNFPSNATVENVLNFLKPQQNQALTIGVSLAEFAKNIRPVGQTLIEQVVTNHPDIFPSSIATRLFMMAEFWENLLALFLLTQCKTRKTLNPDITLQTLSEQMNAYFAEHQREVEFLTHHSLLTITPENVAFAILALDGKISKQGTLGERVTNISANNFLAKLK